MADTVGMPHDGDICTAHDVLDKSVRAPRNDEVYRFAAGEELIYFAVLFCLEQGFRWKIRVGGGFMEEGKKDAVRFFRLFSTLQDGAVSAFHREGGNLDHGVGARFKDHGDDADGTGDAVKAEPFIKLAGKSDFSYGIGKGNELPDAADAVCQFPFIECQPFHDGRRKSGCFCRGKIDPVGSKYFFFSCFQIFNHVKERGISFFRRCGCHKGRRQFHFCRFFFYAHGDSPLLFLI